MKSRKNLLDQLKILSYFDKMTVRQIIEQYGLASATIDTYINRALKYKEIIQLKKGLYIPSDFLNKNKGDISYTFYLANILRTPSYVSSWTALQYYNLATEAIYNITSVTLKTTRSYETKIGNFTYRSIKKDLFSGFFLIEGRPNSQTNKFDFFVASPSKALFDLLYFKTYQFRGMRIKDINVLIEELRIDVDEMALSERKNFYTMIKNHVHYE